MQLSAQIGIVPYALKHKLISQNRPLDRCDNSWWNSHRLWKKVRHGFSSLPDFNDRLYSFFYFHLHPFDLSPLLSVLAWHSSQFTTVSGPTPSLWTPWTRYQITVQPFFTPTCSDSFTIPRPYRPFSTAFNLSYYVSSGFTFLPFCWLIEA